MTLPPKNEELAVTQEERIGLPSDVSGRRYCGVCDAQVAFWPRAAVCHCTEMPWVASTPSPDPAKVEEEAADWDVKIAELYEWTGSDWLSGEGKGHNKWRFKHYGWLCGLAGYLQAGKEASLAALSSPVMPVGVRGSFQSRVQPWMMECFGAEIAADRLERGDRFLEEALELLQANGYPADRVATLRDYVWGRPAGEPDQEVGGVMVTLAALCLAFDLDMHEAGERELTRISAPAIVEKIRVKQAKKARELGASPLPQALPSETSPTTPENKNGR